MGRLVVFSAIAFLAQMTPPRVSGQRQVSPEADRLLHRMSDFLGQQQEFSVKVDGTTEMILNTGQKVQVHSTGMAYVERPGKLRIDKTGDDGSAEIVSDGSTFTFYSRPQNAYMTMPASHDLDATLAKVEAAGVIELPGADLLYRDSYDGLMDNVISGEVLGTSLVHGVPAQHLIFRGRDVDWQIWIQDGPQPLPVKYVITSKNIEGAPEYEIEMSQWNLAPHLGAAAFELRLPADAHRFGAGMQPPR